jgi:excisionase family DNA binding protein
MSRQALSINQAATELGVSTRTIRRQIKSGKIKAKLILGNYGPEYQITELHQTQIKQKPIDNNIDQIPIQTMDKVMSMLRELQEKNLALAAQLGAASERIRHLENKVKLLTSQKIPWWRRIFKSN